MMPIKIADTTSETEEKIIKIALNLTIEANSVVTDWMKSNTKS